MKLIKLAAGIINTTPLDWDGNKAVIFGAIQAAKADGVSVLCLPEMCLCGYGCEDAFHSRGLRRMARQVLREILPETTIPFPADTHVQVVQAALCIPRQLDSKRLG